MQKMQFTPATKTGTHFRGAFIGPSGSGKTFSALAVGSGLAQGGRIAVIDSERGSASKYSHLFKFDTLQLEEFSPETYCAAIRAAQDAGFAVCIVDSLTHAWSGRGGALELVDIAKAKDRSGNGFTAWREVTPKHNELVDTMLQCKMHLIATMRTKTEYVMEEYTDNHGKKKTKPVKVGLQPIQRDGMEYEFDVVGDIDIDHNLIATKTRIETLDGKMWPKPGAQFAKMILDWFADAVPEPAAPTPEPPVEPQEIDAKTQLMNAWRKEISDAVKSTGIPLAEIADAIHYRHGVSKLSELAHDVGAQEHRYFTTAARNHAKLRSILGTTEAANEYLYQCSLEAYEGHPLRGDDEAWKLWLKQAGSVVEAAHG